MRIPINSAGKFDLSTETKKKLNLKEIPQDIYLFNGAHLKGLGEKIRAVGYDPDNPTPEAI